MEEIKSPVKAIRSFCLDCCGGNTADVRECTSQICPLKPFRFGKNPFREKRELSDEQREAAVKRLAEAREKKMREKNGY